MKTLRPTKTAAFTLIELLTVMVIISILAGLVLGIAGFAQRKGAANRADAEIKMMENGCENYKADAGIYPRASLTSGSLNSTIPTDTDNLDPRVDFNATFKSGSPTVYSKASLALYACLSGDVKPLDGVKDTDKTSYLQFDDRMVGRATMTSVPSGGNPPECILDPFSNSYGYSTANVKWQEDGANTTTLKGFNPTFDLWSTLGTVITSSTGNQTSRWSKNW
jgi:prepilin-type N-terminal cleavage/methylation domain-containing protein